MLGWPEIVLIFVVLLLVVGPAKLPEMARTLGEAMREFRKATTELEQSVVIDSPRVVETQTRQIASPASEVPVSIEQSATVSESDSVVSQSESTGARQEEKLEEVAKRLGISPEGKSKEQVRRDIVDRVNALAGEA